MYVMSKKLDLSGLPDDTQRKVNEIILERNTYRSVIGSLFEQIAEVKMRIIDIDSVIHGLFRDITKKRIDEQRS